MTESVPATGGCRCGEVRFRVGARPLLSMACHCRGCQRMTASAFSLSIAVPAEAFVVTAGEPVIGGLHGSTRHFHCPRCKSWLFTRPEGMDWFVNVRSVMLDEPDAWGEPFIETYTSEKLGWAKTPASHSYATVPPMDGYEGLVAEYAARRAG